ncbi:VapB-type antitoxin [Sulfolobus acidocaldarius SUSAZ]|nr:VapB-type antitoxin [Sulfolobus acidocaldarius SUSAZ]
MSTLVRVDDEVKRSLIRISSELQQNKGEKVSINDTIKFLIDFYDKSKEVKKDPQLLLSLLGSMKGIREELEKAREEDESNY